MKSAKILLITQARTGSTRLPGKILLKVAGQELLKIHLERLKRSTLADTIIVATTIKEEDDIIESLCRSWGFETSRGSVEDVLDRFYQTALPLRPEWIVRVTSDCPLIDPALIDSIISMAMVNDADYCSNGFIENYPDGQDVEVFKFSALENAHKNALLKSEREHVTPYIRTNSTVNGGIKFSSLNYPCIENFSAIRMTVDEPCDFELIQKLINELGTDQTWLKYTCYIRDNKLYKINENIIRNEGLLKSLKND